jgi:hypothetical protein
LDDSPFEEMAPPNNLKTSMPMNRAAPATNLRFMKASPVCSV